MKFQIAGEILLGWRVNVQRVKGNQPVRATAYAEPFIMMTGWTGLNTPEDSYDRHNRKTAPVAANVQ